LIAIPYPKTYISFLTQGCITGHLERNLFMHKHISSKTQRALFEMVVPVCGQGIFGDFFAPG
jgi:hypothetical protein